MFATFIIGAYKNKTMNLMFSYPIKRQSILISKMLAVWIFNFTACILTKVLVYGLLFAVSKHMRTYFPVDYNMFAASFYLQLILKAAITISIGFIALYIGRLFKSSKVTLISSFLLIILLNGTIGDITLANNAVFPILLVGISILCAFLFIQGAEQRDII